MSAIQSETRFDLDEILHQSVVDDEFRSQLMADPSLLGLGGRIPTLPTPVEPQNSTGLDLVTGDYFVAQCASTCSRGPITAVCDGTTK